jgi:hypothetical protein
LIVEYSFIDRLLLKPWIILQQSFSHGKLFFARQCGELR